MSAAPRSFRRAVANLDAECGLAAEAEARRRSVPARSIVSRHALPPRVARAISAFGTLFRVACGRDDRLWTPEPVAPGRLAPAQDLEMPILESGPLERLAPASETCWWAGGVDREVLLRVAHRRFAHALGEALGVALRGARLVSSVGELEAHLAAGGAGVAADERWVVKAPYSAAGRSRLRGAGPRLDEVARRRAAKLLDLHGELLFEPWLERLGDFGICAWVEDERLDVLPPHGLAVDASGGFRGVEVAPGGHPGLAPAERDALARCVEAAGRALRAAGYRGPFNLDAWRYRDASGAPGFQPLGEINARWSFGRLAHALGERLGLAGPYRLSLGDRAGLDAARRETGGRILPLLLPSDEGDEAAWLAARA